MTSTLELRAGDMVLILAPDAGGTIAQFYSQRGDQQHHWLRPSPLDALDPQAPWAMGSFPLVPYCNRIRDGRSSFGPRPLNLPRNFAPSQHAIHGTAWQQPWQVQAQGSDHATLVTEYTPGDWPYAFRAVQHFQLDAQSGLSITLTVTNLDNVAMPVGIGHHPYLPNRPGTRLTTSVTAMWGGDHEVMPTTLQTPAFLDTMRSGIALDTLDLDNNFIGWNRHARVDWPDTGTALELTADSPLDYFVLYCPPDQDAFCIEPVSNCTDWMNLAQQGQEHVGGQLLAPNEQLQASTRLRPIWPT